MIDQQPSSLAKFPKKLSVDIKMSTSLGVSRPPPRISAFKAAKCDLLFADNEYPCGHRFTYILDYSLSLSGERTADKRHCPRCSKKGKCLVCLYPWKADMTDSCPNCDCFFKVNVREERLGKMLNYGLKIERDSWRFSIKWNSLLREKTERLRRRLALNAYLCR
jgi:hypothetical protein